MLFKNILLQLKVYVAHQLLLAQLQKKHPTCRFYPGAAIDPGSVFGKYNVVFANVMITDSSFGDHTFIQKNSAVNCASVGKFCSIAAGVSIGLGQHPASYISTHPAFYSSSQPIAKTFSAKDNFVPLRRTVVGHDVWIGQNAMVMDGVTVATGAIVAAGAVVTKNVPEYSIVAGVPAKVIRYRFDENVRDGIIKTRWWDQDEQWLEANCGMFLEPEKFLASFPENGAKPL
jgi:acetyltransferase-like isoleucine patch superfamily enzyme